VIAAPEETGAGEGLPAPDARLRVVVVVPAHDEAERIPACLRALATQTSVEHWSYEILVVLDGCRDATRERVLEARAQYGDLSLGVLDLGHRRGVGYARRVGMDLACRRLLDVARPNGLIASTDADSVVARDWLAAKLVLADQGARAIGGRIELDPLEAAGLPEGVAELRRRDAEERMSLVLARAAPPAAVEHHQFSGASLALTAGTYRECGGLPRCEVLEDEALERELETRGIPIHRSLSVRVSTSARIDGRAGRGLSQALALAAFRLEQAVDH
jgi:glucosyl-3-phosphoglycerate synthase